MTRARIFGRAVAAAVICAAVSAGAAQANDKVTFRDVLKPHGHTRSKSQQRADGRACGTVGPAQTLSTTLPAFEKCMGAKGWVLDHYTPDPSVRVRGTLEHYADTHGDANGHPRGTRALHADERACKARGHGNLKQCLAERGWRLMVVQHGPAPRVAARRQPSWPAWAGSSSSGSSTNIDDDVRHIDEMNRMMQQNSDAASQASVAAQQAADQQQQINNMNAIMPVPQQ